MDTMLLLIIIFLPIIAQLKIKSTYSKYSNVKNDCELTGAEAAKKILQKNGLSNVNVFETSGILTDYYDPKKKIVVLSSDIYNSKTISSIAVAAHECGHAIQDKDNYKFLKFRSALVPIVNFTSRVASLFIMFGFLLELLDLLDIGIICLLVGLLFQLITLPVEFNASARAQEQLDICGIINNKEKKGVHKVLKAAAFTYVAGFIAEALQILRLVLISRNKD